MNSGQDLRTQFQIIGSLVLPMPSSGRSIVKDRKKRAESRRDLLKCLKRKARKKASTRRRRRRATPRLSIFVKPEIVDAAPAVAAATISPRRTKRKRSKAFRAPLKHTRPIDVAILAKELAVPVQKIVKECQLRGLKVRFATDRITNLVAQQIRDYLRFLKRANPALATGLRAM